MGPDFRRAIHREKQMRPSRIKAKLRRNEPVLLPMLHINDPAVYELTSLMGFDGIWLDLEHHGLSVETAAKLMRAARVGGADILVRPAKSEFLRMGRILEAGAQGIMYPRCDDADEAREVVTWAKFAPLGKRGIDTSNPDAPYSCMPLTDYIRMANEETFIAIQVEDEGGVANAHKIAAVEGIDVLFLGTGDFSILSGVPGQYEHPKVQNAIRTVADAARSASKHWGLPVYTLDEARRALDMGARFLWHGIDLMLVKAGLAEIQRQFRLLGFTFDSQL
jgi:4-hydroxy-2-oxoheptanedioate aldolase